MFATLLGALPRPPLPDDASTDALVEAAVRAQEAAGLDPVTDGGYRVEGDAVRAWEATARLTDRSVKHVLLGPYSRARAHGTSVTARALAVRLNRTIRDLSVAGCPLIEIHEPAATRIGDDPDERSLFREAHLRMLDGVTGTHVSLAIIGGSADTAGIETILDAPYHSLAVDLVSGPDNWHLVVATPGERGIVCGALPAAADSVDGPETLLWAAGYAASTKGRGFARVGLATASSLAHLPWEVAVAKMARLGETLRIAGLPAEERLGALDPRAVSSRSAALGRVEPRPSRPPRRSQDPT
jgi:methionine synthase II (cobalamin-independent)